MKRNMQILKPLIIAGPTASGKSAHGVACAKAMNGSIINADSMQIYEDLPILTAHPDSHDLQEIPHRLYGILPGSTACSVAYWLDLVKEEITRAQQNGCRPIIVGGTGMYLLALVDGLSPIPDIDPQVREKARLLSATMPIPSFYEMLVVLDPLVEGKLNPQDTQRLSRAYEVFVSTGQSIVQWQSRPVTTWRDDYEIWVIDKPRAELHQRAADRFDAMLKQGAIDEVRLLLEKDYCTDLPVTRALGVKELSAFVRGDISLDQAREKAIISTRQYIKRQCTFFNNQFAQAIRI